MSFETLNIKQDYLRILHSKDISEPTEIQEQAIPVITEGNDVIAQSQTGTGKTLAYLLPVLQKTDLDSKDLQAVILVPTRELGMQIFREMEMLTHESELIAQSLIGGAALKRQVEKLRLHPQIVVGTPGRVLELIKLRKLKMHGVKTIVVDEVDQVFDLGSMHEVEDILKSALRDRQIVFFSATIPEGIQKVADRWMTDPVSIKINPSQRTAEQLEHLYFESQQRDKIDNLRRIIRLYKPKSAIVFVNEIDHIDEVVEKLKYVGIRVEALYGQAGKVERAKVLNGFRDGEFQILVATDVAARGLDIKEVTHVINFEPPIDADHYVHRVGRTGRMGQSGTAISIITAKEEFIMDKFAKSLDIEISKKEMYKGEITTPKQYKFESRPDTFKGNKSSVITNENKRTDRDKDGKNKGAPKWLKNKSEK
jgi:ATP-dependent RNA helicase DeaD